MKIEKAKPVRELVYEELKKMIIEGTIAPGERIVETEYAKNFQISRTPIREAIRMLELEGFLGSKPNGGVFVIEVTTEDIEEIYKIRIALEGLLIEECINKVCSKDIDGLDKLMIETDKLIESGGSSSDVFSLFSKFNHTIQDIADLDRVTSIITNLKVYLSRFRRLAIDSLERKKEAFDDHRSIVEAIKVKDIKKALDINKDHLTRSKNFIVSGI